jgi:hypothetical protein
MQHVAKVTKVMKVSNGALAFHAVCCGDASTEARATCYVEGKSEAQIDAEVQAHLERTARLHASAQLAAAVGAKYLRSGEVEELRS